jgi:uncharacterized protein YabE (DUF348 family)
MWEPQLLSKLRASLSVQGKIYLTLNGKIRQVILNKFNVGRILKKEGKK